MQKIELMQNVTKACNFPICVYLFQLVKHVIQTYIIEQHPQRPGGAATPLLQSNQDKQNKINKQQQQQVFI